MDHQRNSISGSINSRIAVRSLPPLLNHLIAGNLFVYIYYRLDGYSAAAVLVMYRTGTA